MHLADERWEDGADNAAEIARLDAQMDELRKKGAEARDFLTNSYTEFAAAVGEKKARDAEFYAPDPEFAGTMLANLSHEMGRMIPQSLVSRLPGLGPFLLETETYQLSLDDAQATAERNGVPYDEKVGQAYAMWKAALAFLATQAKFDVLFGKWWKAGGKELVESRLGKVMVRVLMPKSMAGRSVRDVLAATGINVVQGGLDDYFATTTGVENRNPFDLRRRATDAGTGLATGTLLRALLIGAKAQGGRETTFFGRKEDIEKPVEFSQRIGPMVDDSEVPLGESSMLDGSGIASGTVIIDPSLGPGRQLRSSEPKSNQQTNDAIDQPTILPYPYRNGEQALNAAHDRFAGPEGLLRGAAEAVGESSSSAYRGNSPQAASHDEVAALAGFARESGLVMDAAAVQIYFAENPMRGGAEHKVAAAISRNRVLKALDVQAIATESIYDYLTDLELSNHFFRDQIRIEGFYEWRGRWYIVISQPFRHGIHPDLAVMKEKLEAQGLESESPTGSTGMFVIHDERAGDISVIDVKQDNVILEDGTGIVQPIDVHFYFDTHVDRLQALKHLGLRAD